MAVTAFVGVQWQPLDLIDDNKMSQMANGIQHVYDNTPRAQYHTGSQYQRNQGIKIASGRVTIPKQVKKSADRKRVNFNGFFTAGCQPHITTGIMSPTQRNFWVIFEGITRLEPDHNGFDIVIEVGEKPGKNNDTIKNTFAVHWIGLGW